MIFWSANFLWELICLILMEYKKQMNSWATFELETEGKAYRSVSFSD